MKNEKTNTELATQPQAGGPSALALMASRLNVKPANLTKALKDTVFKGASDAEFLTLVCVANQYNLDPLTKQIFAFSASKGSGIVPVVGIDGWTKIINDHPQFDGMEFAYQHDEQERPVYCECTIYRKDRNRPTVIREYLSECERNTEPWKKWPRRMLRHKALIQCARVAFSYSGIHDEEEAREISERNVVAREVPLEPTAPDVDPMTAGLGGAQIQLEDEQTKPEPLTLNNDLTVRERLALRAKNTGLEGEDGIRAILCEAIEAGKIEEKAMDKYSDAELEAALA